MLVLNCNWYLLRCAQLGGWVGRSVEVVESLRLDDLGSDRRRVRQGDDSQVRDSSAAGLGRASRGVGEDQGEDGLRRDDCGGGE